MMQLTRRCRTYGRPRARTYRARAVLPAAALAAALAASGCAASGEAQPHVTRSGVIISTPKNTSGYRGTVFDNAYTMPDVTLTATTGKPFNLRSDTRKPVTLLFFGYTNCPDICPTTLASVASALRQLEPQTRAKIQMSLVTTDPQRDTPRVLRDYLDRFNSSFIGLTGPMGKIKQAAAPLDVSITGTRKQPSGGYTVGHSGQLFAFNRADQARLLWTPGTPVGDLRHDLTKLVKTVTPSPRR